MRAKMSAEIAPELVPESVPFLDVRFYAFLGNRPSEMDLGGRIQKKMDPKMDLCLRQDQQK